MLKLPALQARAAIFFEASLMAGTMFSARVCAGKGSFSVALVSADPLTIKANVPQPPEGGKANRALVLGLEKLLSCRVRLLAGSTSRRKTLAAECNREEIVAKMKKDDK